MKTCGPVFGRVTRTSIYQDHEIRGKIRTDSLRRRLDQREVTTDGPDGDLSTDESRAVFDDEAEVDACADGNIDPALRNDFKEASAISQICERLEARVSALQHSESSSWS